ncbi:MAG TPA: GNAT family N-acetyltransferase [Chitinophagaceae bacterium]|nr:GNAT family N-acetyltransferase [Chitinophagaceae bacterium]
MNLILLAIAPGIAICLFIFYRDAFNKEPKLNLIITFILGALTVFPAGLLEDAIIDKSENSIAGMAIRAFFLVALVEECVKFAVLRAYSYPKKSFDEPLDGIVYGVMASMGFATLENIFYVLNPPPGFTSVNVGFSRMFTAVPGHAIFGVLMGYFAGKAKFNPSRGAVLLLQGLFWAVVFHGAYDFLLFLQESPEVNHDVANGLLFFGAIASLIVGLRLGFIHIKTHRLLSQQTYKPAQSMTIRGAVPADIPLIRDLTYKIWPQTYGSILSKEQIDYMLNLMYSESALQQQMQQNNEFVILYNGNEPIGFASIGQTAPTIFKLHKIYVLPTRQGQGAGSFIIDQVIKAVKPRGATSLQLNVNRQNNAKSFYEKIGFIVIGQEDIDIGSGYFMNDYVMEKKL